MGNDYLSVSDLTSYIKKKFDRDPYLKLEISPVK